jgi:hypothetical protein
MSCFFSVFGRRGSRRGVYNVEKQEQENEFEMQIFYKQLADTIFNSITKSLSCNTRVMLPYDQVVATLNGFKDNPNFSHALYYVHRKITRLQHSNDSIRICNYLRRNMTRPIKRNK